MLSETNETTEIQFMSVNKIMGLFKADHFSLGAARMLVYALDFVEKRRLIHQLPVFGSLADQLNFIHGGKPIAV